MKFSEIPRSRDILNRMDDLMGQQAKNWVAVVDRPARRNNNLIAAGSLKITMQGEGSEIKTWGRIISS